MCDALCSKLCLPTSTTVRPISSEQSRWWATFSYVWKNFNIPESSERSSFETCPLYYLPKYAFDLLNMSYISRNLLQKRYSYENNGIISMQFVENKRKMLFCIHVIKTSCT